MDSSYGQIIMRATRNTLVVNVLLSIMKLLAGLIANSAALVADAVNSISDVFSTVVVIVGVKLAGRKPDTDHPYGHDRLETAAALILSAFILATGVMIGYSSIQKVINAGAGEIIIPGGLALAAAVMTMIVKESMYWYTKAAAKKTGSSSLLAVAWDHRSDVLSSAGAFIGVFGARIGLPILDPIASAVISVLILRVAVRVFRDAMRKMTDTACDEPLEKEITAIALEQKDVLGVDRIRTRLFGDMIYVDIEICAAGWLTLDEAHSAAQRVHDAIEKRFGNVKHCMVHVNPAEHN